MIESFSAIFAANDEDNFDPHKCFSQYGSFAPPGLGNPGNLCFLNSLLQTFASSDQWASLFKRCPQDIPLVKEITKIILALRTPKGGTTVSTKKFRSLLGKCNLVVDPMLQQDMHEFYTLFIEVFGSLLTQCTTSPLSAFSTRRIFPTHCIYEESITCPICGASTVHVEQTSTFVLEPFSGSLKEALNQYFGPTILESKCTNCNRITNRRLKRTILFMPRSILFFINRNSGMGIPSNLKFEFPLSIDVSKYTMLKEKQETKKSELMKGSLNGLSGISPEKRGFDLTCVTVFAGRDNSGHYYTYRVHKEERGLRMKQWLRASDSSVTPVPINEVLEATRNCALLHYEVPIE